MSTIQEKIIEFIEKPIIDLVDKPFISVDVFSDVNVAPKNCYRIGSPMNWDDLKILIKNNILGEKTNNDTYAMLSMHFHFNECVSVIDFAQTEDGFEHILSIYMDDILTEQIIEFVTSIE